MTEINAMFMSGVMDSVVYFIVDVRYSPCLTCLWAVYIVTSFDLEWKNMLKIPVQEVKFPVQKTCILQK